jgi:ABC-type lipoprotein release transport system permease subunit
MITLKLAYRNLMGAGLRTWLNVIVLSLSFVVIISHKGLLDGWHLQAKRDMIAWEVGGGQYWHPAYDPYDPFTLEESHGPVPVEFRSAVSQGVLLPILITQAAIYPQGRLQAVVLMGIDPAQSLLALPTAGMEPSDGSGRIPAVIGHRMAKAAGLNPGDGVMLRWRDTHGTFDAAEIVVADVFRTDVPSVDTGRMWLPLETLRGMLQQPGEATILVSKGLVTGQPVAQKWVKKNVGVLLADVDRMIRQKNVGGAILYGLLLLLAMLAIFDTQVLSIFRRRKEIGMHMALGMTRYQVVGLFTIEGALHSVLAAFLAALYGTPLLIYLAEKGFKVPEATDSAGITIAERIMPAYSAGLVVGTVLIVVTVATVVSFLPATRIARMKPTDAIRGKG